MGCFLEGDKDGGGGEVVCWWGNLSVSLDIGGGRDGWRVGRYGMLDQGSLGREWGRKGIFRAGGDELGGCVVSKTQYASFVSAIRCPSHFICRWRGVRSRRGGRGKLRGLRGVLAGILGEGGMLGDSRYWRSTAEMQIVMIAEILAAVERVNAVGVLGGRVLFFIWGWGRDGDCMTFGAHRLGL